ncbi:LPXTG cell wall anchor domain-containing protein [Alloscardovia venturai]|uniref:LPXTG cell wall anchor domain-containing protein n=1 Tax=Alloscardovia venturai TaxID=1769421 RepID=A0ABW2Y7C4_9BIFI
MKKVKAAIVAVLTLCMTVGIASTAYAADTLKTIYPNEMRMNGTEVTTNNGYEFYNYVTSNGDRSSNGSADTYAGVSTDKMIYSSVANGADIFDIDRANDIVYHVNLKNTDNTQKNVSLNIYMANVLDGKKNHNELKVDTSRVSGDLLGTSVDASLPIRYYFTDGTNVARQDVLNGTVAPDWSTLKEVHVQGQLLAGTSVELKIPLKYVETNSAWDTSTNLQVRDYSARPYKFINLNLVGVRGNKQISDLMTNKVLGTIAKGNGTYEVISDPELQDAMPLASEDFIKFSIWHQLQVDTVDKYATDKVTNYTTSNYAIKTDPINAKVNSLGYVTQVDSTRVMPVLRYNHSATAAFVDESGKPAAPARDQAFYVSMHKVISAEKEVTLHVNDTFDAATYYLGGKDPITNTTINYANLNVTSDVNMSEAGEYTVVYHYTLQDGTTVSRTMKVKVVGDTKPQQPSTPEHEASHETTTVTPTTKHSATESKELPRTGSNSMSIGIFGALVFLGGVALIGAAVYRRKHMM